MKEDSKDLSIAPIDYFASFAVENRILKVLHDISSERTRHGGCSEREIMALLNVYTQELIAKTLVPPKPSKVKKNPTKEDARGRAKRKSGGRSIREKLSHLSSSGQLLEFSQTIDSRPRYKLSIDTLFYIHGLINKPLDFKVVVGKEITSPHFAQSSTPTDPILDEIILVPGSLIFVGEHSALLGQPAIVLPVPLFLLVHATVSKCEKGIITHFYPAFPDPYALLGELSCFPGTPKPSSLYDVPIASKISKIEGMFRKKLTDYVRSSTDKRAGYYIVLTIRSQIPPCVGLGSSAALCTALAILLDRIMYLDERILIENVHKKNPADLFAEKESRLREAFLNATEMEKEVHGETSGVGPFASLFGVDCFTPIWYDLGGRPGDNAVYKMSEILKERKERGSCKFEMNCERGTAKAWELLSEDLAIAAVYTTQSRQDVRTTISDESYRKRLRRPNCRRDFVAVTETLWHNLSEEDGSTTREDDLQDIITCVNLFGQYEEGHLKMLRAENEATARNLTYRTRGAGLGAKYLGAGFGGDILLVGSRENVSRMLVPNYFPVHFTSVNLTPKSDPIDIDSYPKLVKRKEFVDIMIPQFVERAKRAWRSY